MSPQYADYGKGIAEAFKKYLKTGDAKLIDGYSAKELRSAISHLSPYYNSNHQWYRVIEQRMQELHSCSESRKHTNGLSMSIWREKWLDKIVAFGSGIILGAVVL